MYENKNVEELWNGIIRKILTLKNYFVNLKSFRRPMKHMLP